MSMPESAAYLPSDDGQNKGMPSRVSGGMGTDVHPLGPFAPRPCGNMVANAADEAWLPSPSGQLPQSAGYPKADMTQAHGAAVPKGNSQDESWLPTPDGQYGSTYKG